MLLETRLNDDIDILIDAEPASGISKGGNVQQSPDMVLENMLALTGQITGRLREALQGDADPPDEVEVAFAVRVDGNAVVSVARTPGDGQFRITARWNKKPTPTAA